MKFYTSVLSLLIVASSQICAEADDSLRFNSERSSTSMSPDLKQMYANISIIEHVEKHGHTYLTLSDQTVWKYQEKNLFEGTNGWRMGDRVQLVQADNDCFYLENMSAVGYVPVKFYDAANVVNVVKEISKTQNASQNGFNVHLLLSDNSQWSVDEANSELMTAWDLGDHIVISPSDFDSSNATHLLINVDHSATSHGSLRTSVGGSITASWCRCSSSSGCE